MGSGPSQPTGIPAVLRVKVEDRWYTVELDDLQADPVLATVDGVPVEVSIEGRGGGGQVDGAPDSLDGSRPAQLPANPAPPAIPASALKVFRAPMPGAIVSLAVAVGDQVVTGDEVCVLEAMKMQQVLRADWTGIVRAVHVHPGQQVLDGEPLVELE